MASDRESRNSMFPAQKKTPVISENNFEIMMYMFIYGFVCVVMQLNVSVSSVCFHYVCEPLTLLIDKVYSILHHWGK